jgi:hypothetical protein
VVTECLNVGGWANSGPRVTGDPASGPAKVPEGIKDGIAYTVLGVDGLDYTDRVQIGRPTLRWALDLMAIGADDDASTASGARGSSTASAWDPVAVGIIERGSSGA